MSRNSREPTGKQALAARISAQFDHALAEAAETMESLGPGWDDIDLAGQDDEPEGDFLPLEFQLADLERAVDTMLLERDRFLYGDHYTVRAADAESPQPADSLRKGP